MQSPTPALSRFTHKALCTPRDPPTAAPTQFPLVTQPWLAAGSPPPPPWQVMLCIPDDQRDKMHGELCGQIFKDAVNEALGAGGRLLGTGGWRGGF